MSNLPIQKNPNQTGKRGVKAGPTHAIAGQSGGACSTEATAPLSSKEDSCTRCGGFMVSHWCMNVNYDAGGMEILTKRCLQCGEVIDPVILENRLNPNREELKKKTRPLLSRPLASSKAKSSGVSYSPLA